MNDAITYNSSIGKLIEPEAIGFSFNSPGWYMVFGLLVIIAIVIAILRYRNFKKNAYRREAVKQIEILVRQKNINLVFEINILLKSMAIYLFGRSKVASLFGKDWFRFLQSKLEIQPILGERHFEEFTKALYNKDYQLNKQRLNELVEFAIVWVKYHRKNV